MARFHLRPLALAAALLAASGAAQGADPGRDELMKEFKRLSARLEKMEQRNAELEKRLGAPAGDGALAKRIQALEEQNARLESSLAESTASEKEPEIAARLKAVEFQALNMQKQARMIDALEGISAGVSFTTVAQTASNGSTRDNSGESQLNYRADAFVALPGGEFGNASGKLFAQFRLGQGNGLSDLRPTYSSTPNTTAFQLSAPDASDSGALLAQAWYQMDVPMPLGGFSDQSKEHLEINFGKMDPFVFFDQNTAADDESSKFLNNVFVHNPLLDSGGDVGADSYGFSPGLRLAYHNETSKPEWWRASVGVFGSGSGAQFNKSFSAPFVIGQVETGRKLFGGLDGNYRFYLWRNGQGADYDGATANHAGWGVSFDQRVGDNTTLFGRYGHEIKGKVRFDRALTLGAEIGGDAWGRGADAVGIAFGALRTSDSFENDSAALDADGNGTPDFGYRASGWEQLAEAYYRFRLHKQFEITPDIQLIRNAGGNGSAPTMRILGLRAKVSF